jgi:hypothetical protein
MPREVYIDVRCALMLARKAVIHTRYIGLIYSNPCLNLGEEQVSLESYSVLDIMKNCRLQANCSVNKLLYQL